MNQPSSSQTFTSFFSVWRWNRGAYFKLVDCWWEMLCSSGASSFFSKIPNISAVMIYSWQGIKCPHRLFLGCLWMLRAKTLCTWKDNVTLSAPSAFQNKGASYSWWYGSLLYWSLNWCSDPHRCFVASLLLILLLHSVNPLVYWVIEHIASVLQTRNHVF